MIYPKFHAESIKLQIIKLFSIVGYDSVGYTKPINKVGPYKTRDLFSGDGGKGLDLCPLSEIIDSYHCELGLTLLGGQRANDVYSPLSE